MVNDPNLCNKACFASKNGRCLALKEVIPLDCPFQRTDITIDQQEEDILVYSSSRFSKII